jgi:hypothetical protein
MYGFIGRALVGNVVAPTIDLFRGQDVSFEDYIPFSGARRDDYSMEHFTKDLGYTAVGATIAATPQIALVGSSILSGGTVSTGVGSSAVAAAAYIPPVAATVALAAAAGAGHDMTADQRKQFNLHRFRSR